MISTMAAAADVGSRDSRSQTEDDSPLSRYRLHVVAPTVVDVVSCIGGWLVDLTLAGWDVIVLTPDTESRAPLRILGVVQSCLDEALEGPVRPAALAVAATSYARDARVRRFVSMARRDSRCEITLWGEKDTALHVDGTQVEYRLSAAAAAFKTHAMAAAQQPRGSVPPTEMLLQRITTLVSKQRVDRQQRRDNP